MKSFIFAALLAVASLSATAADVTGYASLGTQGVGAGIAMPVTASTNARIEFNSLNLSSDFKDSDVNYDAKIKNNSISVMYDWHMLSGMPSLRATTGVVFNNGSIRGSGTTATPGTFTFNNQNYLAPAGEGVSIDGEFKKTAPYIGIGFGDMSKRDGFSFFGDIGAFYAKPTINVALTPGLAAVVAAADVAKETATLQDHADKVKWYPVLRFGLQYKF